MRGVAYRALPVSDVPNPETMSSAVAAQAAPLLLPGMPTPPAFEGVNPADQPVIWLAIRSSTLPFYKLQEYGEEKFQSFNGDRLSVYSVEEAFAPTGD